jgi:hypothetical protein
MPEMPEDPLRSAIDAIRTRLHDELEAQLAHLSAKQQEELEGVRRAAEADAEQRWASKVDALRSEWNARLESEVSTARAEAERRMVAESMRLRVETEQAAEKSAAAARHEAERALAQERDRAQAEITAERERTQAALTAERERLGAERDRGQGELAAAQQALHQSHQERDSVRQQLDRLRQQSERLERELDAVRQQLDAARQDAQSARNELQPVRLQLEGAHEQLAAESRAREEQSRRQADAAKAVADSRVAERQAQLALVERLLNAIRAMDAGRSLTDILSALTSAAAAEAPRAALFVVNGSELRGWKAVGFATDTPPQASIADEGLLGDVLRHREPVVTAAGAGPAAPAFAALPSGRAALAVPLLVASQPVAVLYADDGGETPGETPASWPEAVQILGHHASVSLAHLTVARTAEVMRRSMSGHGAATSATAAKEDGNSARRYARLLVSEIKLYNEAAVRVGRQKRDLLERLRPEIDRARQLYSQRISPSVDARGTLFQHELVQTLADGDPSLLGNPA